ncbi:hypothetical protein K2173_015537 [Erythroxylum novogranatense]|uniref:GCVT N-terminal domain-containing protein n=1 Tax=Erythroxylum novogranatense TaxID=1862640 RepID=A0AAV8SSY0_9ROSI|nr:hypothetical protein K2173_015537 [Erythroxylum novogranatense]
MALATVASSSSAAVGAWTRRRTTTPMPTTYFCTNCKVNNNNTNNIKKMKTFASHFELSPPPIDHDLLETLAMEGAKVSEDGIIQTYNNDDEAINAFGTGVVVSNLSHFGRIRVTGDDRIQFLHNQSTANFECLLEGEGCDTIFVTPTARTIDIAYTWIMKNSMMLLVSPETCGNIIQMLNKYIFFADKVKIQDITKKTSFFVITGPESKHVNGMPMTVGVGSVISEEGCSLLMSPAAAQPVWDMLLSRGAVPMGSNVWEKLRIIQGRPAPGKELTKEFNVLEAGLWNSISLNKGCYKGQETISRLITYDGVKQTLWGIRLSARAEPGSPITIDGKKVGVLTSYTSGQKGSDHFGLGYIKKNFSSDGISVTVGENTNGTLVKPPYLARQSVLSKSSSS